MEPLLNSKFEVCLVTSFLIVIYLKLVDLHLKSQISLTSYWHWINPVFKDYLQWACNLSGQRRTKLKSEVPCVVDEQLKESAYLLVFPQVNPDLLSPVSLINLSRLSPIYHCGLSFTMNQLRKYLWSALPSGCKICGDNWKAYYIFGLEMAYFASLKQEQAVVYHSVRLQ